MSAPDCRTCDRGSVNRCDPWESTSGATVDATVDAITRKEDTE